MNNTPLTINGEMIKRIITYTPDGTMYWLDKEYEIFKGIKILFSTICNVANASKTDNMKYNEWNHYIESIKLFRLRLNQYLSKLNLFIVQGSYTDTYDIDEVDISDYMTIQESADDLITAFDKFIDELIKYYSSKTLDEQRVFMVEGPILHSIKSYASELINYFNIENIYTFATLSRFLKCIDRVDE